MRSLWMSAMPRLAICPASGVMSEGLADASNDASAFGSAYHDLMAYAAAHGVQEAASQVETFSRRHSVSAEELRSLVAKFTFDPTGGSAEVRVRLRVTDDIELTGIIDLHTIHDPAHHEVLDYKTTHYVDEEAEPDEQWQLVSYGIAIWDQYELAKQEGATVLLTLAFPRKGTEYGWAQHEMNEMEVEAQRAMVNEIAIKAAEQYDKPIDRRRFRTGSHCQYCRARQLCPALATDLKMAMTLAETEEVTPENIVDLYGLRVLLARSEKAISKRARELVLEHGPIDAGAGKHLEVRTTAVQPQVSLDVVKHALRRCGVDSTATAASVGTIEARQRVNQERLGVFKERK